MSARVFHTYHCRNAVYRMSGHKIRVMQNEIRRQRHVLEVYLSRVPQFGTAMHPVPEDPSAPALVRRMLHAGVIAGVGPMAAVAGAIAQAAVEAAVAAGADEAIVDNGGDLYFASPEALTVALYAGGSPDAAALAFRVLPQHMPLAVCSSSSLMGHSLSFGRCRLATVVSHDAALADAAATAAANRVQTAEDLEPALQWLLTLPGVSGGLLMYDHHVGMAGTLPELIRSHPKNKPSRSTCT